MTHVEFQASVVAFYPGVDWEFLALKVQRGEAPSDRASPHGRVDQLARPQIAASLQFHNLRRSTEHSTDDYN